MGEKRKQPKLRFPEFTDDWEQRKLGELASEFQSGKFVSASEISETGEYPVYGGNGLRGYTDHYNHDGEFVLIGRQGALCGNVNKSLGKAYFTEHAVVVKGNEENDTDFLFHLFSTMNLGQYSDQSAQPGLAVGKLIELKTMVPKLTEQRVLSEYLSNLDHLITLHQRKCDQYKELKTGMLQKMFPKEGETVPEIRFPGFTADWEQRKLGELVISHNAGIYISKEDYGTGTNVIGVGNIYDNDIFDGEIYRLGPVNDEKFLLEENDLIYGESSLVPEGIARTVCVGKNGVGSAFAWHTRRVKLDQSVINSHFATLELNYNIDVRKYLISVSTQTALTGMTTEGYFGVTLSLPTVEEQAHISSFFKQIDNLITLHQRKCDQYKELKKGLLQQMFV